VVAITVAVYGPRMIAARELLDIRNRRYDFSIKSYRHHGPNPESGSVLKAPECRV